MVSFSHLVLGASVANAGFIDFSNFGFGGKDLADYDEDDYREAETYELSKPREYPHDGFAKFATCPGSGAREHTMAQSTITFDNSCDDVMAEMQARANGESGWQDPHNRGTYTLLSADSNMLKVKRRTGNNRYTDVVTFSMTATSGAGCKVNACSESQGNSNNDAGTNMCNMANLYCNSSEQAGNGVACKPIKTDLTYTAQTECGRFRGDGRYRQHNCQPLADTCLVQPSLASAVVLAAPRDYRHDDFQKFSTCPGSGARQHTMAQSTISFTNTCSDVMAEMQARANGENGWQDPHNRGQYTLLYSDANMLKVKRRTGNNRYTDVVTFSMTASGEGCKVNACSESQGNSNNDAGTNMCNMANLYCNSSEQAGNGVACKPIKTDLTYTAQTECGRFRGDGRYREHNCQPLADTCLRQPSLASAVVLAAPRDYRHDDFQKFSTCPGSGARQHTMAQSTISFTNSCSDVMAEMQARANGEGGWQDPHNRGQYTLLSADSNMLKVKRRTGNNRYTDVVTFSMTSSGAGCKVNACSESQGNSNNDAGTNMCNMANLYCNSSEQASNGVACKPIKTDLTYTAQTECGRFRGDGRYRQHNCQPLADTCLRQPSELAHKGPFHVLDYLLEASQ